jgi:hypothetical protein
VSKICPIKSAQKVEFQIAHNVRACCCAGILYRSVHNVSPIEKTKDEDMYKSSIMKVLPKPLLIENKKLRIYSSASIAASPLLPAVKSFF